MSTLKLTLLAKSAHYIIAVYHLAAAAATAGVVVHDGAVVVEALEEGVVGVCQYFEL